MNSKEVDFCIVGSGFAGLTAAYRLTQAGHTVAVLEARDRIGGRVWTKRLEDGTPVDMGGTFIAPKHEKLRGLIKELGCETTPTPIKGDTQMIYQGKLHRYKGLIPDVDVISLASMWASLQLLTQMSKEVNPEAPWECPKAIEWDSTTLGAWIDNPLHAMTAPVRSMLRTLMIGLFTCDPSEMSLLNVLYHVAASDNDIEMQFKVEGGAEQDMCLGGMGTLLDKMAATMTESIHLESPVRKINQNDKGVEVVSDKTIVRAKRVIVCVPPNLVDNIEFTPPLPATRADLMQRTPAGRIIKFIAVYNEPFWRKDGLNGETAGFDHPIAMTLDTSPPGEGKTGTLTCFAFAQAANKLAETSAEVRKGVVLEALVFRFGEKAGTPLQFIEYDWGADPWTRGCSMAHFPPGILTNFAHVIRDPAGRIHFATTENSAHWNGFIEGAVRSGERAAKEVVDAKETAQVR